MSGPRRCPRAIPIFAAAGTPQILLLVFVHLSLVKHPASGKAATLPHVAQRAATPPSTALRFPGSSGGAAPEGTRAQQPQGHAMTRAGECRTRAIRDICDDSRGIFCVTHLAIGVNVKSFWRECKSTKLPGQGPISEQTCQSDQVCIDMLSYNESISHDFVLS